MHCPRNTCVLRSDFLNKFPPLVIAKEPKASRLTLDPTLRILVSASWSPMRAGLLGADEKLGRTVADPRDADRRMNLDCFDVSHYGCLLWLLKDRRNIQPR